MLCLVGAFPPTHIQYHRLTKKHSARNGLSFLELELLATGYSKCFGFLPELNGKTLLVNTPHIEL